MKKLWMMSIVALGAFGVENLLAEPIKSGERGMYQLDYAIEIEQPKQVLAQNQQRQQNNAQQQRGRQRHLTGEARTSSAQTNIDFEAAAIDGERRAPMGVAIGSNKPDHEYDLINLRLRWHPEMIKSTSHLETGRGQ